MNHADLGGLNQRLADRRDQLGRLDRLDRAAGGERLGQGLGVLDVLGRDPGLIAPLARREDRGDRGALDPFQLLELALDPLRDLGQGHHRGRDES